MRFTKRSEDSSGRTFALAETASNAGMCVDIVNKQVLADACRTFPALDMCLIFMTEVAQSGEDRVWSCLTKSAESVLFNIGGQLFQVL